MKYNKFGQCYSFHFIHGYCIKPEHVCVLLPQQPRRPFGACIQQSVVEVWLITGVGVVLIHVAIVIVIHSLGLLLAMFSCFDLVVFIQPLRLSELVNFGTDESGKEFFGETVVDFLACALLAIEPCVFVEEAMYIYTFSALLVFVQLHAFKGSGATDELVGELALVAVVILVDLLVCVAAII
jgi:hypothetical protein